MSDTPASWQPDPTGRHDHRYWDGTRWTEHVADAGVAGVDPFDEPAADDDLRFTVDAPQDAGEAAAFGATPASAPEDSEPEPSPAPTPGGTSSGWALPAEEEAPPVSGWGAPAEPEPTGPADAPAPPEPEPEPEPEPVDTGWAAAPTATPEPAAEEPAAEDEPTAVTAAAAATTSPWDDHTSVLSPTEAEPEPEAGTAGDLGLGAASGYGGYGGGTTDAPTPPPATPADGGSDGSSRKVLILVVALLAIAGLVIALVALTGGDDDGGSGGGGDAGRVADRISEALQRDLRMDEDDADCIGRFITDEIGAQELSDVDFDQPEAPDDLEDDFNRAFNAAIGECDLDVSDLAPSGSSGASGADDGDAGDDPDDVVADPEQLREVLSESYRSTLGIEEGKASCLADRMVAAVESGEIDEDDAYGNFFGYLEECQISLEELTPPAG